MSSVDGSTHDAAYHHRVLRLTGGYTQLARETASLCARLQGEVPADWMNKRLLFFNYEIHAHLPADADVLTRLNFLIDFLFAQKKFTSISPPSTIDLKHLEFSQVLTRREGHPLALAILFLYLADRLQLCASLVQPSCWGWIKIVNGPSSFYIDLGGEGARIEFGQMLERLTENGGVETVRSCAEPLSCESVMVSYASELRRLFLLGQKWESALLMQDIVLSYQPSNITALGERAILHRRLGNFKSAMQDLKRYFSFVEQDRAPASIQQAYTELTRLLNSDA